jgi:photosystem II stability/assembly factor-like uncharacterized protein
MKRLLITLLFFSTTLLLLHAQEYQLKEIETNVTASFRGLTVVNDRVAWVSGNEGWVGITTDGGNTWNFNQVNNFETSDFRSIYAFNDRHAVIANAGSPANILITSDGGKNWKTVYTNSHKDAFFDGIDFLDSKEGIIYGDPIDGKMLLLRTMDGGLTWTEIKSAPVLEKGEASFAASGTGIRCSNKNQIIISTGGTVSRLWLSKNKGQDWTSLAAPIMQGESSTGIFSFIQNNKVLIIVGGDYLKDSLTLRHNYYSLDKGKSWLTPAAATRGYRECVEAIDKSIVVAVGPTGADISDDNGIHWKPLSNERGLHVIRKARKGLLIIIAGGKGKLFVLRKSN